MSKNLIPIIAEKLGVEIEEEFRLKGVEGYKFFIDSRGYVQCFSIGTGRFDEEYTAKYDLQYLLNQPNDIIKAPFEPKENEKYWTYFGDRFSIDYTIWGNTPFDYGFKSIGCVFRTKEEAINARAEVYKRLTGKEWENE